MKICFIGFGRRGKTLYGDLLNIEDVEVVGICDPGASNPFPAKRYASVSMMFKEAHPDLVIDVTPPAYRFDNILLCNKFQIPVICEKPFLFTRQQINRLRKITISVYPGYQFWFDVGIQKAFTFFKNITFVKTKFFKDSKIFPKISCNYFQV